MFSHRPTSAAAAHESAVRFAAGDPDAIREMYQTYGRLVYAVAYRVLGDVTLAEDAVEQTFVQAWRTARASGPPAALGSRIATIAYGVAMAVDSRDRRSIASPSLAEIYAVWEVRQALQDLPAQDRDLIRLQHHGELTHAEIGRQLAIPPGIVPARNVRALRRLAGLLSRLRLAT
jgi:RNA polymerase sigma factor (sigma-70 family)